jgi:hypothetical protein
MTLLLLPLRGAGSAGAQQQQQQPLIRKPLLLLLLPPPAAAASCSCMPLQMPLLAQLLMLPLQLLLLAYGEF